MSDSIIFYHHPLSRGRSVHWMLEEIGVPYEVRLLNLESREHKSPAYLTVNPMGKVPTLVHNGAVVTETAAICTYLADAFPRAGLSPSVSDHVARATYLRWLYFGAGCIDPAFVDKLLSRPLPARGEALGYGSYEDVLKTLERGLAPGPFILGDRFSAADVYVGSLLVSIMTMNALEPNALIGGYVKRLTERPAFRRVGEQGEQFVRRMSQAPARDRVETMPRVLPDTAR